MSELNEIYREVILDHNRQPRNFGKMDGAHAQAKGHNPLCGDQLTVYLVLDDDEITDIRFDGAGCAICMASTSLMTESLKGKHVKNAEKLLRTFHQMLTEDTPLTSEEEERLGKLLAFSGVREFPVRVKCATLPWHTFAAALKRLGEEVTTE